MPYCRQAIRDMVLAQGPTNAAELHYALALLIVNYLGRNPDYQRYCDVEGVLGHAAKELYRRRVGPYEDGAIARNGDIDGYNP